MIDQDTLNFYMNYLLQNQQKQSIDSMSSIPSSDVSFGGGVSSPSYMARTPQSDFPSSTSLDSSVVKGTVKSGSGGSGGGGLSSAGVESATGWSDMVNSIISNSMHRKYASLLENQKMTLPSGLTEAEGGMHDLSTQGLPGYDKYRSSLFSTLPMYTAQARETGQPASVLKGLTTAYTNVENALNNLNISDADAHTKNQLALYSFLSSVKAPYEQRIQEFDISKTLAAEQERMQGKKELLAGASSVTSNESGAVGSILNMLI